MAAGAVAFSRMKGFAQESVGLFAAQEAAIADATHDLREEFERLKAELDKAKTQRDAMFHEIETLRGKTGYCIGCAERAIENDRLVSEIRRLRKAGDALAFILRPINEAPIAEVEAWRAAAGGGE